MKFSSTNDINAPQEFVFAEVTDFDTLERQWMRMGATVDRADDLESPGTGMIWIARAEYRGKRRKVEMELVDYDPPNVTRYEATSQGLNAWFAVEIIPLSMLETRMRIHLEIKPTTLSARVLVQSARLAKSSLSRRFKNRCRQFGDGIETKYERGRRMASE